MSVRLTRERSRVRAPLLPYLYLSWKVWFFFINYAWARSLAGKALRSQRRDRGFESHRVHQKNRQKKRWYQYHNTIFSFGGFSIFASRFNSRFTCGAANELIFWCSMISSSFKLRTLSHFLQHICLHVWLYTFPFAHWTYKQFLSSRCFRHILPYLPPFLVE